MFTIIREKRPRTSDWEMIGDIILTAGDFFKGEIAKLQNGKPPNGNADEMIQSVREYVDTLKGRALQAESTEEDAQEGIFAGQPGTLYAAKIYFDEGCQMETIRAFAVVNNLMPFCSAIVTIPKDLMDSANDETIASDGLGVFLKSEDDMNMLRSLIEETIFIRKIDFHVAEIGRASCRERV